MDLTALLAGHGEDEPSGENLEYDPAFIALELAAQPGEERQVGDSIIAAEEPDHAEVIAHATEVLERSHDLRAAVFLASSLLRTKGFAGFADATGYIRGVLETWWDTCHPQLDADDDNDPTERVMAVRGLADPNTMLRALRLAPLTDSRSFGRFSLRDIAIAKGEIAVPEGEDNAPDTNAVSAAFQDTDPARLQDLRAAVETSFENVKAIGKVFDDRIPTLGPDLDALEKTLRQALAQFAEAGVTGEDGAAAPEEADEAAGGDAPSSARGGGGGGGGGAINSQQDVRAALDRIMAYYARQEPSSPLPILLARAKRLVGADFMTIIKDMAPDGTGNVMLVGGITEEQQEY